MLKRRVINYFWYSHLVHFRLNTLTVDKEILVEDMIHLTESFKIAPRCWKQDIQRKGGLGDTQEWHC